MGKEEIWEEKSTEIHMVKSWLYVYTLVGGWAYPSEKYDFVSWDDDNSPYMESHRISWFQTTTQLYIQYLYLYIGKRENKRNDFRMFRFRFSAIKRDFRRNHSVDRCCSS
jgi:hypothetical protein